MRVRLRNVKHELVGWGAALYELSIQTGLPSSTVISKIMELGPGGAAIRSNVRVTNSYWPKKELTLINEAVSILKLEYRNIVIMKYVESMSFNEIGQKIGATKWSIMRRMVKIELEVYNILQNRTDSL